MTLLTICRDAARRIGGIDVPTTIVANTSSETAQSLLGLAQQEGKELSRRSGWQALTKETTFSATATETQSGVIPSDLDRYVNETFYNRTRKRPVQGPLNAQEWQALKGLSASTVYDSFRIRGDAFLITPTPTANDVYAFEYITNQWCESSGGSAQSAWAADADVALIDEELMTLGLIWRWKKARGFDYSEEFRTYELQVSQAIARDGPKKTINFSGLRLFRAPVVPPEGNWAL